MLYVCILSLHGYFNEYISVLLFFSSRRRHTRWPRDWSSDVCSSDLDTAVEWIASGRSYNAETALKRGVVDAVVASDQLHAAGLHTLAQCRSAHLSVQPGREAKTQPLKLNTIEASIPPESTERVLAPQAR